MTPTKFAVPEAILRSIAFELQIQSWDRKTNILTAAFVVLLASPVRF